MSQCKEQRVKVGKLQQQQDEDEEGERRMKSRKRVKGEAK